LTDSKQFHFVR